MGITTRRRGNGYFLHMPGTLEAASRWEGGCPSLYPCPPLQTSFELMP
jgi:hypothetical protein